MSDGGGTNSMAMLIGLRDAGRIPDLIMFADTGGERPHTYQYMQIKREWLKQNGFPDITVVRNTNKHGQEQTLEQDCLNRGALPSGFGGDWASGERLQPGPASGTATIL
jgi:hypothetical protein